VLAGRDELISRFLAALDRELQTLESPTLDTVFLGGGTPTHLSDHQLAGLFDCLYSRIQLADGAELTIEANPEDINETKLRNLRELNVNRISLGVQSFLPKKLRLLERGHDSGHAKQTIALAASYIPNVSIDLIFAAPEETIDDWRQDLETAVSLPIRHLSTYQLTIEKGTSFYSRYIKGDLTRIREDDELAMYQLSRAISAVVGMEHYEISNFAQHGSRCRHNLAYWQGDNWFAVGPGAARFYRGRREVNHRSTTEYIKRSEQGLSVVAESESISPDQFAGELAAFGVRLVEGIDLEIALAGTGVDVRASRGKVIERLVSGGWIVDDGRRIQLTERGLLFADSVASELLEPIRKGV
jgi:oxygen-independent coproporphyrinogen-3 oxidase